MKMNYLTLLAALLALSTVQSKDTPKESLKHQSSLDEDNASVTVKCTAPKLDPVNYLSIFLGMSLQQDDVTMPIASQRGAATVVALEGQNVSATGDMSDEGGPFLEVSMPVPEDKESGKFLCRFAYFDLSKFQLVTLNDTFDVQFTVPEDPTEAPTTPMVLMGDCSCEQVWNEVKKLRETLIAEKRELTEKLKSYSDACRVSFTAQLSNNDGVQFMNNQPVVFDKNITNQGAAYDVNKGIFTAPCRGQYFFRLSMRTHQEFNSGRVDGVIEVNGEETVRTNVFTPDQMDHVEQASNGVVLVLSENDEVQVRVETNSDGRISGRGYSTFTGFFISP